MRRFVALLVVVGLGLVMPNASARAADPAPVARGEVSRAGGVAATAVLVKYRPGANPGRATLGEVGQTGFVKIQPDGDPAALVAELAQDPAVEAVSLDYPRFLTRLPHDGDYAPLQTTYLATLRLPEAWDRVTDASSQVIAVVDTGVDANHPDLAGALVPGYNAVSPGSPPSDEEGHGTIVAGIAAARTDNLLGVSGAAWNGRVMPVKVFTGDRISGVVAYDSDIAEGILWAVDHGARIVNLSLGGPGDSPALHDAITYATSHGALVIASSGNDGDATAQFPAAYPEVLSVGATDQVGALADFSSWGDWIDVVAPGVDVVSTYPSFDGYPYQYSYAQGSGTSFAAPLVAGIAALVRSAHPDLGPAQVADRLRQTARDGGPRGLDPYYGYGLVDAAAALGAPYGSELMLPIPSANEPNDVPARATPFTGTTSGVMATTGDVDWYRWEETTPRSLVLGVELVSPGSEDVFGRHLFDPMIEVFDSQLRRINVVDHNRAGVGEGLWLTLEPGTHYLRVSNINGSADPRPYTVNTAFVTDPSVLAPAEYLNLGAWMTSVAIGDVTGDARNDVVVLGLADGGAGAVLVVVPQGPPGTFGAPAVYTPTTGPASEVALLDVDRDGDLDVAVTSNAGIEIFRQAGVESWPAPASCRISPRGRVTSSRPTWTATWIPTW